MKPVSSSAAAESRMKQRVEQEAGVGPDRPDLDLVEHVGEPGNRLVAVIAVGDQLGDHRVVERRDLVAFLDPGFDPAFVAQVEMLEPPDARQEALRRVLGIQPRLDRPAVDAAARPASSAASPRSPRAVAIRPGRRPVISSVTGCSTCSRVFISMNQMRSARRPFAGVGDELDRPRAFVIDRLRRLTAAPHTASRVASSMPGAGASSMTFWWRRWSEQSRSNRWTTLPWLSPNTCTSIWRGLSIHFSISTTSLPNDDAASRLQLSSASSKSAARIDLAHALAAAARDRLDQHRIADRRRPARLEDAGSWSSPR